MKSTQVFIVPSRPVYTVVFDGNAPVHDMAYVVIDGVERIARVDVQWRIVPIEDVPEFIKWAAGYNVRLLKSERNMQVWERE